MDNVLHRLTIIWGPQTGRNGTWMVFITKTISHDYIQHMRGKKVSNKHHVEQTLVPHHLFYNQVQIRLLTFASGYKLKQTIRKPTLFFFATFCAALYSETSFWNRLSRRWSASKNPSSTSLSATSPVPSSLKYRDTKSPGRETQNLLSECDHSV